MKVLFVCVANVGRSQVAQELFNRISRHRAESAGTRVADYEGHTVQEWADDPAASTTPGFMLEIMRQQEGIDFAQNRRRQLTPQMVKAADRVIVIAEPETQPDYLRESSKVEVWDIPDLYWVPRQAVQTLKEELKRRVEALVREIG